MNRTFSRLLAATAILSAGVGSLTLASALTVAHVASPMPVDAEGTVEQLHIDPLLPGTSGREPLLFSDRISTADGTTIQSGAGQIVLRSSPDGQRCFDVALPAQEGSSCFYTSDLRSGLGYAAFQGPDGEVHIVGLVPDDVATVVIDGHTVNPESNIWTYDAPRGTDLAFTVSSLDGSLVASLGADG